MGLHWDDCFLCNNKGRLTIGENHNKFFECKNVKCPLCNGHGRLAIKSGTNNPWNKKREDYL